MDADTKQAMGDAAALIREHLWQGREPPRAPDHPRKWTMGRELSIWKRLVSAGWSPEELNGAISVVRTVRPYDGKMRLTWFYFRTKDGWTGTPLLEACVGYFHKNQRDGKRKAGRLPPSVRSVLKDMVG